MATFISQILKHKGSKVWTIAPEAKIYEALALMKKNNIGALVVLDAGRVVGLFTERDHCRKVDLCGLNSKTDTVGQAMSKDVYSVTPQTTVEEAMAIVTESRNRHLTVLEDGELVGLASIGDLVKATLDEKDFAIEQLTSYIKGDLS